MEFWSLRRSADDISGRPLPFAEVWALQKTLVEQRARDEIPDTFLFLEHTNVVTRGRGLQWTGTPRERAMPFAAPLRDTDYFEIERGGDLTWHGPGQLVLYPIVKLDGQGFSENHDVTAYLRRLERATIELHTRLGLQAEAREHATGVWVGPTKTASLGIAIRKWVTYHGAALNVTNTLNAFSAFSPCGFASEVMTSLERLVGIEKLGGNEWRARLEELWRDELLAASLHAPQSATAPVIRPRVLS